MGRGWGRESQKEILRAANALRMTNGKAGKDEGLRASA
jgi:hypothetical protein